MSLASVPQRAPMIALSAALAASSLACGGIEWMRPHTGVFEGLDRQICVESALRRSPDAASLADARDSFVAACEGGEAGACSALGVMYERGLGVAKSAKSAAILFDRACRAGNAGGCGNLGVAYAAGQGVAIDPERAASLFAMSCTKGDARGCIELASVTAYGQGVPRDPRRAAELLDGACKKGHPEACFRIASMFEDGTLGPDPVAAMSYFEKACVGGAGDGCDRLDAMYQANMRARPPTPHPREIACLGGDARACNAAALGHFGGEGVERNLDKAVAFMRQACQRGYTPSCDVLGPMLHGSCARGDSLSCTALAKLANTR
jgi:hypothetical protein